MAIEITRPGAAPPAFPRYLLIAGHWINSYKVLLCVGIYVGSLATAALAVRSGLSPLVMGLTAASSALAGLAGARIYHVLVHLQEYRTAGSWRLLWDTRRGGWSVFGALLTFVPASYAGARWLAISPVACWDHMALGVLAGGFWIRCGCVFNGCCVGRPTDGPLAVWLHDTRGVCKRRVPVQYLEMAWWLLGAGLFVSQWSSGWAPGSYALGVLAWYGAGRTWLEPLREDVERVFGRVPINQVIAALLAVGGAVGLFLLN